MDAHGTIRQGITHPILVAIVHPGHDEDLFIGHREMGIRARVAENPPFVPRIERESEHVRRRIKAAEL